MLLARKSAPTEPDDYKVASSDALRRMLKSTRDEEFRIGVELVHSHAPTGAWLDIGCSYGWFLQQIASAGYEPYGVEPSLTAWAEAQSLFGERVVNGEFPTVLANNDLPARFDVLSTMDVLEHIIDPSEFLQGVRKHCNPLAVFLVKVPSNDGLLFRLFSAISTSNRNLALSRMWQVDFNYPHWHYYSPASVRLMLAQHGFEVLTERRLPFAFFSTATDRIRSYRAGRENPLAVAAKALVAYILIA
ncbi:MAG: class I SAM-dependent methyltransferase, partial [Lysobacter sp.]